MHTERDSGREAEDTDVWRGLMEQLSDSVEQLADDFVERVADIPSYRSGTIATEELHAVAVESLGLVVAALADPDLFPRVERYGRELGERRAAQGVPSEALTSAVRLNFPVIWSKLTALAGPEMLPVLVSRVESVWRVLDEYAIACYSSYVAVRMREARTEVSIRQEFIAAMFTAEGQSPESLNRFSSVFQAPIDEPYGILAVTGRPTDAMREIGRAPLRFLHETGSHAFLFWPMTSAEMVNGPEVPDGLPDFPCGISMSGGLGGIAAAATRAKFLADNLTAEDAGPLSFERAWPRLSRTHLAHSGFLVAEELDVMLGGAKNEDERLRIRETVEVFLKTGSISETSRLQFAHRNTVLNRLRRFGELTGIDLRVPTDAARVVIAWLG